MTHFCALIYINEREEKTAMRSGSDFGKIIRIPQEKSEDRQKEYLF